MSDPHTPTDATGVVPGRAEVRFYGIEAGEVQNVQLTGGHAVLTATVAQTAPVFLTGFVTSQGLFLAQLCAAAFVVSLPVLVAGFAAQDKLVQGLSLGAVK